VDPAFSGLMIATSSWSALLLHQVLSLISISWFSPGSDYFAGILEGYDPSRRAPTSFPKNRE